MAAWMKQVQSSGGRQLLSVVYLVAAVVIILPATSSRWRQWLWREDRGVAHLHFYMHDVLTGPDATAVDVVNGTGRAFDVAGGLRFGQVVVMDDVLTEGPSRSSPRVGRTQGFYVFSDMNVPALLFCMNVVLTAGPYDGSTVTILGRDHITQPLRPRPHHRLRAVEDGQLGVPRRRRPGARRLPPHAPGVLALAAAAAPPPSSSHRRRYLSLIDACIT